MAQRGNPASVTTLEVYPRQTPAERADELVAVDVDDELGVFVATIEDWVTPRPSWEVTLREGTEFGRVNNVEARLLFVGGEQTASLAFRLDQLDGADDTGDELVLRFEEREGIAKLARLTGNGLDVELFHILTYT
ncbi:MAG: hypothetical protein M3123_02250 [Actinomycetota bacterium]|nr:hypothetical protein [Actinomycetota bacterium]